MADKRFMKVPLRAWLGGDCVPEGHVRGLPGLGAEDGDLRPLLGEELLASFALEELLPADAVDAREAGRFELVGIGDWLRPLLLRLHPQADESGEDQCLKLIGRVWGLLFVDVCVESFAKALHGGFADGDYFVTQGLNVRGALKVKGAK